MDVGFYERPASAEGWIVLASDANIHPHLDSTTWRLGLLAAALEALRAEWPQSAKWPVAFAGLSGGAKRSGVLGPMLARTTSVNIRGFFLCGINDDRLSWSYREYHPDPSLLDVPIWLSSGIRDRIATTGAHEHVKLSLQQTGFRRVRVELFDGGHQVKPGEVVRALKWFRELGKF
jgi:surfactin synthase thioesterase subunit